MKLSTEVISQLKSLRDEIKSKQTEEKKLCERIKRAMKLQKLKVFNPKDSEWKFLYTSFKRTNVSWHQEWEVVARKLWGKRWKSYERRLEKENRVRQVSLNIEKNEKFKGAK
jgi:hypothetical protein